MTEAAVPQRGQAALFLLSGIAILSLQDSLVKFVADYTSFWQFQTLRSASNLCLLAVMAATATGWRVFRFKRPGAVALRSLFLTICMFCFFAGAPKLTFAQMATGLYTYPMFVTVLSGLVLGERVGPWRLAAILTSATGAMLIIQPWQDSFSAWQVLPMMAGFFYALNVLMLRRWCQQEHPMALAMAVGFTFSISGLIGITILSVFPADGATQAAMPFVVVPWPELTGLIIGVVILTSLCNLAGNLSLTRAYQTAEPSWLAPFDYSYLALAVIWGLLIFEEVPGPLTVLGMALIAFAGIVTAWREVHRQPLQIQRRGPMR